MFFGICWFVFGLLHLIKFMYKFHSCITMEEHWVYLACVGFFVILSRLILSIKPFKAAIAVVCFLLVFYSGLTFVNAGNWKEELNFYRYNLKYIRPSLSIIPRLNFSTALYKRGLHKQAIEQVHYILSVYPDNVYAYIQLGDVYLDMKEYREARQAYQNALKIDYFCWQANRKLKLIAEETGQEYKDELEPGLSALEAQIISFLRLGEFEKALEALKKASFESPSPQVYTLSGLTFGKMGLYKQAIASFNAALRIDPDFYPALYNLSVIYANRNETKKVMLIRERMAKMPPKASKTQD